MRWLVGRFPVLLFGMVFVALVLRWILPTSLPEARETAPPDIPEFVESQRSRLADLVESNLWSANREIIAEIDASTTVESEGKGSEASRDGEWSLVGVSHEGRQSLVIVTYGDVTEVLEQGDHLPDGSRIESIDTFGITTERSGAHEKYYLFGQE